MFVLSPQAATSLATSTQGQGFVVFAQLTSGARPIKIEGTRALAMRLRALDDDCPYEICLIGLIRTEDPAGDATLLHEQFASTHMKGDWFTPNRALTDLVAETALPALQELLEQFQPTSDDGSMLTVEELAEQLGISVPTVRRMVKSNQLPHVRIGRQIRFVPEDILASLRLK